MGCLRYVLRERRKDKGRYSPPVAGTGGGTVSCASAPVATVVIRTIFRGVYIGTVLDRGNCITAVGYPTDKSAAWHLAEQAAIKGWTRVQASGNDNFLRWNYDFLLSRGIHIVPKDDHQARILAEVKKDRADTGKDKWAKIPAPPPAPEQSKPLSPLIIGGNMAGKTTKELSREFATGRRQRPNTKKPVWHSTLSLKIGEHLSQAQWKSLAAKYIKKMGFGSNHEFVVVQHFDRDYEHVHLVVNRIGLDGQLWAGRWEAHRAHQITNALAAEFGLETVDIKAPQRKRPTRGEVNKAVRTGKAPERMNLQRYLDTALNGKPTTNDFLQRLKGAGVIVLPNIASTGRMNGFSFTIEGSNIHYSGSSLGKKYTWKRIKEVIDYEQDRDAKYLIRARDIARTAVDQNSKGAGNGYRKQRRAGSYSQSDLGQPASAKPRSHATIKSDLGNNDRGAESDIGQGKENKQYDLPYQGSGGTPSSKKNLVNGNDKRPGRRDNRRGDNVFSPVKRWPFDGPYQFLNDWWVVYKKADGVGKEVVERLARRIRDMISSEADISPAFQDAADDYYAKAVAEILSKSPESAASLTASDINSLICQIMKQRERPNDQIKSVLSQSPLDDGGKVRTTNNKIVSKIARELAPRPEVHKSEFFSP